MAVACLGPGRPALIGAPLTSYLDRMSSQQPAPGPIPPSDAPLSPPPRRGRGPLVAALLVGVLLGGAGVGVAWAVSGDDGSANDAAGDARDACRALNGIDESKYTAKGPEGEIALNRFGAALTLSAAAAAGDDRYKPLSDAMLRLQSEHARTYNFGDSKVKKSLAEARRLCQDI
ncbi:hypothetical protein SPAR_21917 [Streptomyces sparsogenes DSM 40356]|uniref:Uncharacterized protein n=2 Tax=Streptomyces sparsogenes TaxID=67365 RepID=A0A1R1SG94_9ACTN|nr:hypothetical protein SPAR_21917 [Streptomyces sparsogenes DSM 40356]